MTGFQFFVSTRLFLSPWLRYAEVHIKHSRKVGSVKQQTDWAAPAQVGMQFLLNDGRLSSFLRAAGQTRVHLRANRFDDIKGRLGSLGGDRL